MSRKSHEIEPIARGVQEKRRPSFGRRIIGVSVAVLASVGTANLKPSDASAEQGPCPAGSHVRPGSWDDLNGDNQMQYNEVACAPDVVVTPTTKPPTVTTAKPTPTTKPPTVTTAKPTSTTQPWASKDDDGDKLVNGFDPNPNDPDSDDDTVLDGHPSEIVDKYGDGTLDLLQSRIDIDGDGTSAETGDTDETNPCIPSKRAKGCDSDNDGIDGPVDLNPDKAFADIDGDEIDDTALPEVGGDTDLTDGPKADKDNDGVPNKDDKQDQELVAGQSVDENGVIIVVDNSVEGTVDVTNGPTTTLKAGVVAEGNNTDSSSEGSGPGGTIAVGALIILLAGAGVGGVKYMGKSRRQHAHNAKIRA